MKRFICALTAVIMLMLLPGCSYSTYIRKGYVSADEYWEDAVQDFTHYCKYYYSSNDLFEKDSAYRIVTDEDIPTIRGIVEDFSGRMESGDRLDVFDFSMNLVNAGDYFALKYKYPETPLSNYDLFYFDVESHVLYFMHSNV